MSDHRLHFDKEAQTYPISLGDTFTQARKWQIVEDNLPRHGLIMDVGAATGRHALRIKRDQGTVVAVDSSYKMVAQLQRSTEDSSFTGSVVACTAELPNLPFSPDSFDIIYCFSTLLLLPSTIQAKALLQMANLLKHDGILIVDVANSRSLGIRYWNRYYRKKGLRGVFGHTKNNISRLFEKAELQIELMEAHGLLSQLLLFPPANRLGFLSKLLRGTPQKKGWDAIASAFLPYFSERWYIVAHSSRAIQTNAAENTDKVS